MRGLIFTLVLLASCALRPSTTGFEDVVAIDDGAVALDRPASGPQLLLRLDREGQRVWSVQLQPRAQLHTLSVRAGLVTVRRVLPGLGKTRFVYLDAYAVGDGMRQWSAYLGGFESSASDSLSIGQAGIPGRGDRETLVEVVILAAGHVVVRIDPLTGEVRARESFDTVNALSIQGPNVHVDAGDTVARIGTVRRMRSVLGWGCARGDTYVHFVRSSRERAPLTYESSLSGSHEVETPERPVSGCAFYRDLVVAEIPHEHASSWLLVDQKGHVTTTLELPGIESDREWIRRRFPDAATLGAELPRFVPVVLSRRTGQDHLVLLDLELGRVIPTIAVGPGTSTFRVDGVWYVIERGGDVQITTIDASTGRMLASAHVEALSNSDRIEPPNVADGSLWLVAGTWHSGIARLDARTLTPAFVTGDLVVTSRSDSARLEPLKRVAP